MLKAIGNYLLKELKSFKYAFRGIKFLAGDHNFYFHFPVGVLVLLIGAWFGVSRDEWLWLILGVGLVWVSEAFNTAIEKVIDLLHPEHHPLAGKIKDIAAAAVFLAVVVAGCIGIIIFWPYLMLYFY